MTALPEIAAMAAIAAAGLSYRTFLHTHDDVERMIEGVVAERVAEWQAKTSERRDRNLAIEIGNNVVRAMR
jgi:hypothetical protein